MLARYLFSLLLFAFTVPASAQPDLEQLDLMFGWPSLQALDPKFQCVFKNPTMMGASITHESMQKPPLSFIALTAFLPQGKIFGPSPAGLLTTYYARGKVLVNHSSMFGSPVGMEQIETILKDENGELTKSSAIIGVDAFYWDAAWEYCPYTEDWIRYFLSVMKSTKIPVILGTVPADDPKFVTWSALGNLQAYVWTPPQAACLQTINETLRASCKVKDRCYLVDFHRMVNTLNSGGTVQLNNGKAFGLWDIRPDGVHLSMTGSEFVAQEIYRELDKGPALCEEKKN